MKLIGFEKGDIKPIDTVVYNCYYNICHGDPEGWLYKMSVDKRFYDPAKNNNLPIVLNDNNYTCNIIKDKEGTAIMDSTGKPYRTISKKQPPSKKAIFNFDDNDNDIILFCQFETDVVNVSYSINGMVEEIGCAQFINDIEGTKHKVPGPVLLIYGNCTLKYRGFKADGSVVDKTLKYNYENNDFSLKD